MKIVITGSAKEIADFAFLLQSQRELRRKPYTNETELLPVILREMPGKIRTEEHAETGHALSRRVTAQIPKIMNAVQEITTGLFHLSSSLPGICSYSTINPSEITTLSAGTKLLSAGRIYDILLSESEVFNLGRSK